MRQAFRKVAPALALLLTTCAAAGRAQEAGERVGKKLDQVGREIRGGLDRAGQEAKERFTSAQASIRNMGVEGRIYGRLHWDKALNDATIDLAVTEAGVVTLSGAVATAPAKARAVELAKETVGVTEVVDRLAVRPAATTTPARPRGAAARP